MSSPRSASTRSHSSCFAARRLATAFFGRTPLGLCLIESLDGAVRLRDQCAEPRIRLGIDRERSGTRELEPVGLRMRQLHARVGNHGRGRERLHPGEHRRDTLPPLFERGALRGIGLVDALDHRSRALRDRLVLRARRGNLERAAHVGRRTVSQSLERGEAGVLVFRLEGDVEELRRIGHAGDGLERGLRVERVARDAAQRADVMHAPERRGSAPSRAASSSQRTPAVSDP